VQTSASEETPSSLVRKTSALDKPPSPLTADIFYGRPLIVVPYRYVLTKASLSTNITIIVIPYVLTKASKCKRVEVVFDKRRN